MKKQYGILTSEEWNHSLAIGQEYYFPGISENSFTVTKINRTRRHGIRLVIVTNDKSTLSVKSARPFAYANMVGATCSIELYNKYRRKS